MPYGPIYVSPPILPVPEGLVLPRPKIATGVIVGGCYENALNFATVNADQGWLVVHGVMTNVQGKPKGEPWGHGWCELDINGFVIAYDPTSRETTSAGVYHQSKGIIHAVDYTLARIAVLAQGPGDPWGPWDAVVLQAKHD